MKCPQCNGKGKIGKETPTSMETTEFIEEECDVCGGTGEINEDILPILNRLDRIIEILENKNIGGK
jgi:excinuclease UvrABC ATPase subunit